AGDEEDIVLHAVVDVGCCYAVHRDAGDAVFLNGNRWETGEFSLFGFFAKSCIKITLEGGGLRGFGEFGDDDKAVLAGVVEIDAAEYRAEEFVGLEAIAKIERGFVHEEEEVLVAGSRINHGEREEGLYLLAEWALA